jgi:thioredoxin reductase (NADPH)
MIRTDVVIVGAGPVGLFQVFELGLLGLHAHVIDSLPQVGGQCMELYPDKPIYDIPAVPVCTGKELTDNLLEQIRRFDATFHTGQTVVEVKPVERRFHVTTSGGKVFDAGAVIVAAGVGAFEPRRLRHRNAAQFENSQIFYRVKDRTLHKDRELIILGGGDSALDWTLDLIDYAASVVLVHRTQKFRAAPDSVEKMRQACKDMRMQFLEGDVEEIAEVDGRLTGLKVKSREGYLRVVGAEQVLCFWGLSPKLGPITKWGLDLNKAHIAVDTEKFQTNIPGIFAVGDINTYPGKKKLILSGFHEAALAAFAVAEWLNPGEKIPLQYTTTSPAMHKRLGVEDPYKDDLAAE